MSTRTMEARAVITAADKTGRVFQQVAGKMKALNQQARAVGTTVSRSNAMMATSARALAPVLNPSVLGAGAVALGIKHVTDEALSLERTMIKVGKATNASGSNLKGYETAILDLARATGKSKEEVGDVLAAAAFAGRPAHELLRYTEYATKATGAWGTSAKETGQALAELGNIYKADQGRLEEIGDAINHVADNAAASEPDLIEFLRRSGAVGAQAGMTAEQTIAIGAAMKEVGVNTEVAANTYNTLMNAMALGDGFLKSSGRGFKALGLDAAKVQKEFAKKPLETTVKLLERINKVKDPIKRAEILTDMFGKEYQDNIAILAGNIDGVQRALGLVANKGSYAGSVMRNFQTSIDTDVGRIERATQAIDVLSTRAGNGFKLVAGDLAEGVNRFVDGIEKTSRAMEEADRIRKLAQQEREKELGPKSPLNPLNWLPTPEQVPQAEKDRRTLEDLKANKPIVDNIGIGRGSHLLKNQTLNFNELMKSDNEEIRREASRRFLEQQRSRFVAERSANEVSALTRAADLRELADRQRAGGGFGLKDTERKLFFADHDLEVMRRGNQSRYSAGQTTYSWAGDDSDARGVPTPRIGSVPLPPPRPVDVTGKVELDPSSKATVQVMVKVDGGQITGMSAQSSGNIQANVGTSMPHIKAGPR